MAKFRIYSNNMKKFDKLTVVKKLSYYLYKNFNSYVILDIFLEQPTIIIKNILIQCL